MVYCLISSENYNKMGILILYLVSLCSMILSVCCESKLIILHAPNALHFGGKADLKSSNLKNVFSTSLGYSVEAEDTWSGLEVKKPFGFAKALFLFHFPGMTSFGSDTDGSYPIVPDGSLEKTWNALIERTEQRYPDRSLRSENIVISNKIKVYSKYQESPYVIETPTNGPIESINVSLPNNENDNLFIKELNKLHAVVDQLLNKSKTDGVPDLHLVTSSDMSGIMESRGADSKEILLNAITTLCNKIKKSYHESVLIAVLTDSEQNLISRSKRDTAGTQTKPTLESINVAEDYDQDFPVIFNIVFWFSLAMLFAVIAICLVIGGMDPGRDSIIYRMTSTRMKKDN